MKLQNVASDVLSRVVWAVVLGLFGAGCGGGGEFRTPPVSYNVCFSAGGLNRLVIAKANPAFGICTRLTLVTPALSSALNISVPFGWGVETASVSNNPADCQSIVPRSGDLVLSTRGIGAVTWESQDGGVPPRSVNVDARVFFHTSPDGGPNPLPRWAPPYSTLDTDLLPVVSCSP